MGFDPKAKRLRCMGHIFNLIAERYLYGQDVTKFEEQYSKAGAPERRKLWRERNEVGKLHNLVAHVMASGKRTELFEALQSTVNVGIAEGKRWKLVLDGGIRWNSTYSMIRRAIELQDALDIYALKLQKSGDAFDQETYDNDYLSKQEWKALKIIKDQLEPLFLLTKCLEGNADLKDGAYKASHGSLWETLPVLKVLDHFEGLEKRSKNSDFDDHPGIQNSITEAWHKTKEYYAKTDTSIAWVAALTLHPRFKFEYFEKGWSDTPRFVTTARTKLKKLWTDEYRPEMGRVEQSPDPEPVKISYLESVLNRRAGTSLQIPVPSGQKDELDLYLKEPPKADQGVMEYWRAHEYAWPNLTRMAFDFLAIPAMSSECERVFSSCAKETTPESSRLSGLMLWHQECLKNWQARGAISIQRAWNGTVLDI